MRTWRILPLAVAGLMAVGASRAAAQTCPVTTDILPYVSGFQSSLFATHAGDGTNRLFVLEQAGRIRIVKPAPIPMPPDPPEGPVVVTDPFLTIPTTKIVSGGEQGFLGLAFHPQFATNGRFFVTYTRKPDGAIVLAEYHAASLSDVADTTETVFLVIPHPGQSNHNSGMIAFGVDGFLYMSVGDGGGSDDVPNNNAQNINVLLGKMLRLDVDTPNGAIPYSTPADNPYVGIAGADEIYALGLRNAWRWSFDPETHKLIAGDVGQGTREEVDFIDRTGNYGWRVLEGTSCHNNNDAIKCNNPILLPPLLEYGHSGGRCSITGGYVYRGSQGSLPDGQYVYADYCTGELFDVAVDDLPLSPTLTTNQLLRDTDLNISSFGEDEAGEIYVVGLGGSVSKLVSTTRLGTSAARFGNAGGSGHVDVVAPTAACGGSWTAVSNAAFLHVTSGATGTGNGTVDYSVDANPNTTLRTGTLTIAGRTFTVTQDESTSVTVTVDDVFVAEGASGTHAATFLVELSGAAGATVSVQYATAPGTATAGTDYTTKPLTTLTFVPGETSKPVSVLVKGDTRDENDETFFLDLSNPTGVTIADAQAVGTIVDDDAQPTLAINSLSLTEGSGSKNVTFTVSLSAVSGKTVTVHYATGGGTATAGVDYTAKSGDLTFTPGQVSKSFTVATKGDLVHEPNETFLVTLSAPTNALLGVAQGTATILDDDPTTPAIHASINDVSITEGNTGSQLVTLTVTLAPAPTQAVSVGYATAADSATSADFGAKTGTLSFAAGQTSKTLTVGVKGDVRDENDERFFVNLQSPQGLTISDGQGIVTIVDNDAPPVVSIGDVAVTEGNSGTKNATFTVSLSAPSAFTVTVQYDTQNGTATTPSDYTDLNGPLTLTFTPGQTSKQILVPVKGDSVAEPTEAFTVVLTSPVKATLGDASGTATITDTDGV